MLGWYCTWHVEEALRRIVAWSKAWLAGEDMFGFTLSQIHDFLEDYCL